MSEILQTRNRGTKISKDSIKDADFNIYVSPLKIKRVPEHVKIKLNKQSDILSYMVTKIHSIKSKTVNLTLKQGSKKIHKARSSIDLLVEASKTSIRSKASLQKAHKLEKTVYKLKKHLEKANTLYNAMNESIKKNRQHLDQKISKIEFGYLSRLMIHNIYRFSLGSQSTKAQREKMTTEIRDIYITIKEYLQEAIDVYLSIDRVISINDDRILTKMKKHVEKLSDLHTLLQEQLHDFHDTKKAL